MKDALRRPPKASNGEERQKLQDKLSTLEIQKQNAVEVTREQATLRLADTAMCSARIIQQPRLSRGRSRN